MHNLILVIYAFQINQVSDRATDILVNFCRYLFIMNIAFKAWPDKVCCVSETISQSENTIYIHECLLYFNNLKRHTTPTFTMDTLFKFSKYFGQQCKCHAVRSFKPNFKPNWVQVGFYTMRPIGLNRTTCKTKALPYQKPCPLSFLMRWKKPPHDFFLIFLFIL